MLLAHMEGTESYVTRCTRRRRSRRVFVAEHFQASDAPTATWLVICLS
jgi:hypothetical protein